MTYPDNLVERVALSIVNETRVRFEYAPLTSLETVLEPDDHRQLARAALDAAGVGEMLEALRECREACLFGDDDGGIGVTEDPHIPFELFERICAAIAKAEGRS